MIKRRIRRRTQLFIAKRFQIRYISLILIFMFATAIATGYMVYVTTWIMFGEKLAAVYPQGLLLDIVKKVNMVLLLRLLFLSPLVILIGLILSHRIAGPIYRIRRHIRLVANGDYDTPLKLREKDELQDLAVAVNHLVSKLRSEKQVRRKQIEEISKEVDDLEASVIAESGDKERALSRILEIKGNISKLR